MTPKERARHLAQELAWILSGLDSASQTEIMGLLAFDHPTWCDFASYLESKCSPRIPLQDEDEPG